MPNNVTEFHCIDFFFVVYMNVICIC